MPPELAATGRLPSPPGVVMEILRLVADEDSTVDDLASVIDADPVLAARLLGTVNSGLYTLVREIHSIDQAAVLVGFRAIRTLAMSVSLSEGITVGPECIGFDLEMYWRHSLMTSVLAKRIAAEIRRGLADDAFSVGLIANVGRLVIARCIPERYSPALAASAWPDSSTETLHLGYSSAQVSAALLRQWGLPPSMCASVRFIDDPTAMPDTWDANTTLTAKMVSAADKAVDHLLRAEDDDAIHTVADEVAEALDLSSKVAHEVLADAGHQVSELQHLVSNNLPDGINPTDLLSKAQHLLEEAGV